MWPLPSFIAIRNWHCKYCKCTTYYVLQRHIHVDIANYCIELLYLKMKTLNTLILFYLNRIQLQAKSWASHKLRKPRDTSYRQYNKYTVHIVETIQYFRSSSFYTSIPYTNIKSVCCVLYTYRLI